MSVLNLKNFPDGLHHAAKIAAVKEGIPLREWLIKAIEEKLAREKDSK